MPKGTVVAVCFGFERKWAGWRDFVVWKNKKLYNKYIKRVDCFAEKMNWRKKNGLSG